MGPEEMREYRARYNERMADADSFFREFGALDDAAYAVGAIDRKHKELMGPGISAATRCNECILYHLDGCASEGASRAEIVEAVKTGTVAGGSLAFPNVRFAFAMLEESASS